MEIEEKELSLNQIIEMKTKLLQRLDLNDVSRQSKMTSIDEAEREIKRILGNLRKTASSSAAFKSKAKWFEYGEKPNKFFLNLNKCRQQQKLIGEIKNGDEIFVGHEQVSKGIAEFYRNLYAKNDQEKKNFK